MKRSPVGELSDEELAAFERTLTRVVEATQENQAFLAHYQEQGEGWERTLFTDMFGAAPQGEVHLRIQPHFLYWEITDTADWLLLGKKVRELQGWPPSDDPEDNQPKGGAFVFPQPPLPGVAVPVGAKRLRQGWLRQKAQALESKPLDVHEERHGIDVLLEDFPQGEELLAPFAQVNESSGEAEIEAALRQGGEKYLESGYRSARSEVLAFFEPAEMVVGSLKALDPFRLIPLDRWIRQLPAKFFFFVQKHSGNKERPEAARYDYVTVFQDRLNNYLETRTGKRWDALVEKETQQLAGEFREQLLSALVAVEVLGAHSTSDSHAFMWLLENQPLERWTTLVRAAGNEPWKEYQALRDQRRAEWVAAGRLSDNKPNEPV